MSLSIYLSFLIFVDHSTLGAQFLKITEGLVVPGERQESWGSPGAPGLLTGAEAENQDKP